MRIIHPAVIFIVFENYFAMRKRKMFGRMQVRPFDVVEREFRSDEFERAGTDVDVERAVEVSAEVESARGEERPLAA